MKAYSMKKIRDYSFNINFKIDHEGQWHFIINDLKSKIQNRFKTHLKNVHFYKKGFGIIATSQVFDIKKEINGKKIIIGNFKIKKGDIFSKNVYEKDKIFRKDFYVNFFISINPYSEKLDSKLNFTNPKVRDNIYDNLRNIYKPINYD